MSGSEHNGYKTALGTGIDAQDNAGYWWDPETQTWMGLGLRLRML